MRASGRQIKDLNCLSVASGVPTSCSQEESVKYIKGIDRRGQPKGS